MDPDGRLPEEEFRGASSSRSGGEQCRVVPRAMEGLRDAAPPPFLAKTYDLVEDPGSDGLVSWSSEGRSFVVWDPQRFSINLLPSYFKHNNFCSFVRQLNSYGFRKVDPDKWEFANQWFLRGHPHFLENIRRRKRTPPPAQAWDQSLGPCVELGRFGSEGEVDRLMRDKQVLTTELVKLRQEQQTTRVYLREVGERLKKAEQRQRVMMGLMAKAMSNPGFLQQLVQQKSRRRELDQVLTRKRTRPTDAGPGSGGGGAGEMGLAISVPAKREPHDSFGFEVSELEQLAMDMQRGGGSRRSSYTEQGSGYGNREEALGEGRWEELLEEEMDKAGVEGDDEDASRLPERLGYLGSNLNLK